MARISLNEDDLRIARLLTGGVDAADGTVVILVDDEAACAELGLHRDTYAYRLKRLTALGAIFAHPLPRGPRRPDPRRRIELSQSHWLWRLVR